MAITVTQLNKYIKSLLETDINLSQVSIRGEISNFKHHSSGHFYLTLKDENAAVRAVMFRSYASRLKFMPENGMKVIVSGKISLYERDGQYQIYISSMQPDGIGDLHIAYEQLKSKLESEGVFNPEHKKPIPKIPKTVGVITSPTGAAIRDIINVCSRRFPMAEILVCPVLVQGDDSARQIAAAIEYMNSAKCADVLIVGRGGGSIEDLWSFNEEVVAYAIYNSDIPVISAVGHETDFTIADFAADMRAPTPSAAAELAVPSAIELKTNIISCYNRMLNCIRKSIDYKRTVISSFAIKNPVDYVNQNRLRTDNAVQRIAGLTADIIQKSRIRSDRAYQSAVKLSENIFTQKSGALDVAAAKLDALSPLKVMNRGYSVAKNKSGILKSIDTTFIGDTINVKLNDGSIDCTVNQINKEK